MGMPWGLSVAPGISVVRVHLFPAVLFLAATPSPSPTASRSSSSSPSRSPSATPLPTASASASQTTLPTLTSIPTATASPSLSRSRTGSPSGFRVRVRFSRCTRRGTWEGAVCYSAVSCDGAHAANAGPSAGGYGKTAPRRTPGRGALYTADMGVATAAPMGRRWTEDMRPVAAEEEV